MTGMFGRSAQSVDVDVSVSEPVPLPVFVRIPFFVVLAATVVGFVMFDVRNPGGVIETSPERLPLLTTPKVKVGVAHATTGGPAEPHVSDSGVSLKIAPCAVMF